MSNVPSWASGEAITSSKLNGEVTQINQNEADITANKSSSDASLVIINTRRPLLWSYASGNQSPLITSNSSFTVVLSNRIILPTGYSKVEYAIDGNVLSGATGMELRVTIGTTVGPIETYSTGSFVLNINDFGISSEAKESITVPLTIEIRVSSGAGDARSRSGSIWAKV